MDIIIKIKGGKMNAEELLVKHVVADNIVMMENLAQFHHKSLKGAVLAAINEALQSTTTADASVLLQIEQAKIKMLEEMKDWAAGWNHALVF